MGGARFHIVETNPNDAVGGKGCLGCGISQDTLGSGYDCHGPYVVFSHSETASNLSPHAVLCAACLQDVVDSFDNTAEPALAGGEHGRPSSDS